MFAIFAVLGIILAPTISMAVNCDELDDDGFCPAGCYEDGDTCNICDDDQWSAGGENAECQACQNAPSGADYIGPGTSAQCPWQFECRAGTCWDGTKCADLEWNQDCKKQTVSGDEVDNSQIGYKFFKVEIDLGDGNYKTSDVSTSLCEPGTYGNTVVAQYQNDGWHFGCIPRNGAYYVDGNIEIPLAEKAGSSFDGYFYDADKTNRFGRYNISGTQWLLYSDATTAADAQNAVHNDKITLYAKYTCKSFTVNYYVVDADGNSSLRWYWHNCEFRSCNPTAICTAQLPEKLTGGSISTPQCPAGQDLAWWYIEGGNKYSKTQVGNKEMTINDPAEGVEAVKVKIETSACPIGFYCESCKAHECPAGHTTDAPGASSEGHCGINFDMTTFTDGAGNSFTFEQDMDYIFSQGIKTWTRK